jgi:hypothetical protein
LLKAEQSLKNPAIFAGVIFRGNGTKTTYEDP